MKSVHEMNSVHQRRPQQHFDCFQVEEKKHKSGNAAAHGGTEAAQSDPFQRHLSSRADGIIIPFLEKCSRYVPSGELFTHFVECDLQHD